MQARRSRARRLRLRAAAGVARTCVARLEPPRPLTRWPSPRRRGPRSPCDDLCGPAECPTSAAHQCQRLRLRKTDHLPSSAGAPARLVGRAPSSTIRTHLAPAAQPPVALAGAVTLPFPASFLPISSRIGFLTEIQGTEPQRGTLASSGSRGTCWRATRRMPLPRRCRMAMAARVVLLPSRNHAEGLLAQLKRHRCASEAVAPPRTRRGTGHGRLVGVRERGVHVEQRTRRKVAEHLSAAAQAAKMRADLLALQSLFLEADEDFWQAILKKN